MFFNIFIFTKEITIEIQTESRSPVKKKTQSKCFIHVLLSYNQYLMDNLGVHLNLRFQMSISRIVQKFQAMSGPNEKFPFLIRSV